MALISARINGTVFAFNGYKQLAHYLLNYMDFNSYIPLKARVEKIVKIMQITEFYKKAKWIKDYVDSEEKFRKVLWNLRLDMDNLGTLPGFLVKAPIEKGRSNYNPELIRISIDWTKDDL